MRLFGVSVVRNEADVIEAFVRHNLTFLDSLTVVDHASADATPAILACLAGEGLPVRIVREDGAGFFQAEWLTAAARELFIRDGADFVFPIDADEFIKAGSRGEVERELSDVPAGAHAVIRWLTYVPESLDAERAFGPSHLRWRIDDERQRSHKCVIGRSFGERPAQYVVSGNHLVDDPSQPKPPPHLRLRGERVALAHCPVRSAAQLERKVRLGYQAHRATEPTNEQQFHHWRRLYEELSSGERLTPERLREIACNYGLPADAWRPADAVKLVEDPVRLAFVSRPQPQR